MTCWCPECGGQPTDERDAMGGLVDVRPSDSRFDAGLSSPRGTFSPDLERRFAQALSDSPSFRPAPERRQDGRGDLTESTCGQGDAERPAGRLAGRAGRPDVPAPGVLTPAAITKA